MRDALVLEPCRSALLAPKPWLRLCCLCILLASVACQRESTVTRLEDLPASVTTAQTAAFAPPTSDLDLSPRLLRRFAPIYRTVQPREAAMVSLGRLLYFEPLLSSNGKISCNSCHPLDHYGTTNSRYSIGVRGHVGRRNAPTVYNAAGLSRFFWDGRADTLAAQAAGPLGDPTEMGMNPVKVVAALVSIPGYQPLFTAAFPHEPQSITFSNVTAAIAEFERGLITPARWDRYLLGDKAVLSSMEKEGARLFANLGCMVCHTGAYVGGTMFEKLGIFVPWPDQSDHGRREITRNPADDMVFKVPSLRNVAMTAPYFHDGSTATLDTAVRLMARHQLGVDLSEEEARSIAAWLGSLSGDIPTAYIAPPSLPAAHRP